MRIPNIELPGKTILVTGAAGFIGSNLAKRLLESDLNINIVGFDNLNDYYDIKLKEYRIEEIRKIDESEQNNKWTFIKGDIAQPGLLDALFLKYEFDIVIHLAAQAGVRYSITNPESYIESYLVSFFRLLEACRKFIPHHLIYASSSSVYGANSKAPYDTDDKTDSPVSLYAATKKADELMAYAYSSLYGIPATGLRFFTVYVPCGRPDMAYFTLTDKLKTGEKIKLFNYGRCKRDFTYIDDIVEGIIRVMLCAPDGDVKHKVYNIGNHMPVELNEFVQILSDALKTAEILPFNFSLDEHIELVPAQPGDVKDTFADVEPLKRDFGFSPSTSLKNGLDKFARWYKEYYK